MAALGSVTPAIALPRGPGRTTSRARRRRPAPSPSRTAPSAPRRQSAELRLPPAVGRRSRGARATRAKRVDGVLLGLGQPRPVEREVPARGRGRRARCPGRSSRAAPCGRRRRRGCRASSRRAGTPAACGAAAATSGSTSRRSPSTSATTSRALASANRAHPSAAIRGTASGHPSACLRRHPARAERAPAALEREELRQRPVGGSQKAADSSARWSSSWRWCASGHRVVARGDRSPADVAQQQRRRPSRCGRARRRRPPRRGRCVGAAASSRPEVQTVHGSAAEVAEAAHRPVVVRVQVLQDERARPSITTRSRTEPDLASLASSGLASGGAGDQLLDRARPAAGARAPSSRPQHAEDRRACISMRDPDRAVAGRPLPSGSDGHRRRGHRGGAGRHRHRRRHHQVHAAAPVRAAVGRPVPLPRREDAVVQREPGARALPLLGLPGAGRRHHLRPGGRAPRLRRRRSSCSPAGPGSRCATPTRTRASRASAGTGWSRPSSRPSTGTTSACSSAPDAAVARKYLPRARPQRRRGARRSASAGRPRAGTSW